MKKAYKLVHKHLAGISIISKEKIYDTKILGFFSSEEKCKEAIQLYKSQPGFKRHLKSFFIEEVEADINCFNDIPGDFDKNVYFLSHEWYDGKYDYVSYLGYYSTKQKAEEAKKTYRTDSDFVEHPEGFEIGEFEIDEREWTEGYFTYAKKTKVILICCIPILIWFLSFAKCEIDTILHGKEFEGEYNQTNMIGGNPKPKVLTYSDDEAKVYYVDELGGIILWFENIDGEWIMEEWDAVWAKGGSADGFMWPYGR